VKDSKVSFRLSPAEIGLLYAGLALMAQSGRGLQADGMEVFFDPYLFSPSTNKGMFDAELAARVSRLWERVQQIARRGGRMCLDPFELAALQLAIRVTKRELQHGDRKALPTGSTAQQDRLMNKLERLRKQAKRGLIQISGRDVYVEWSRRWRGFVRWLRVNRLQCEHRAQPACPGLRRLRITFLNELVKVVADGFTARGLKLPSARLLRRYVRLAKREVHRGRAGLLHPDLLRDAGREYLVCFVLQRMRRDGFKAPRPIPEPQATAALQFQGKNPAQQLQLLKSDWPALEPVARAEQVAAVRSSTELSVPELSRALDVRPGTIRREARIAALSEKDKGRIRSGESITQVLDTQGLELPQWQRANQMTPDERIHFEREWRRAVDAQDGRLSRALADRILAWAEQQPIDFETSWQMFDEVERRIYFAHLGHLLPQGLPSKSRPEDVIAQSRPPNDPEVLYLEILIRWVIRFAALLAPEYEILERALQCVQKRLFDVFELAYRRRCA